MPGWNDCSIYEDACRNKTCEHVTNKYRTAVSVDEQIIDIVTDRGIPFRVVYGHRKYRSGDVSITPVVALYDRRYEYDHLYGGSPHGQFVTDYLLNDFLAHGPYGLDLAGGVDAWTIDKENVGLISIWLRKSVLAHQKGK